MTKEELEADLLRIRETLELINKVNYEPLFATEEDKKIMLENISWLFGEFRSTFVTEEEIIRRNPCGCWYATNTRGHPSGFNCSFCNNKGYVEEKHTLPRFESEFTEVAIRFAEFKREAAVNGRPFKSI